VSLHSVKNYQFSLFHSGSPPILLLIVWVYLHWDFFIGLQKMDLFCNKVCIDLSRSSKVDDFGTNRKRVWYFLLVRHSNQGSIISDMLQLFGWRLQIFPILLSCGAVAPLFRCSNWNFVVKFTTKKLVTGLFSSEDRMIVVWVILIQHQRVTERRTSEFL